MVFQRGFYPKPWSIPIPDQFVGIFFFEFLGTKFAKLPKDSFLKVPSGKSRERYGWWKESGVHQLIARLYSLSYYLQGFIHFRWCRISSINSMDDVDGKSGEPVELGSFDPSILEVVFPYILGAPGLNLSMKNIFPQMIIVLRSPNNLWKKAISGGNGTNQ